MKRNETLLAVLYVILGTSPTAADWPQFRGPESRGVALETDLTVALNEDPAWEAELPGRGASGPIVVDDRVIVTCSSGAEQDRLHVLCFDANSGEQLWHRQVWATGRCFCHASSSVAAPTPASDGKRIFAFFSSNDLVCLDLDGNLLWMRGLAYDYPKAGNDVGMASSPVVVGDTVVVQVENQGDSFATGLNVETGTTRWRVDRAHQANWASPVVLEDENQDLVLLQSPNLLTAHHPISGDEMWRYDEECATITSPLTVGQIAYVPSNGITALDTSGAGTPETVWKADHLSPSACSPVVYQDRVYAVNRAGVLHCGDARTGDLMWRLRLSGRFWATPVVSGEQMLLVSSDGLVQLVDIAEKGKLIGEAELGEEIQGTPAVADGAVYVRSDGHLWRFGDGK